MIFFYGQCSTLPSTCSTALRVGRISRKPLRREGGHLLRTDSATAKANEAEPGTGGRDGGTTANAVRHGDETVPVQHGCKRRVTVAFRLVTVSVCEYVLQKETVISALGSIVVRRDVDRVDLDIEPIKPITHTGKYDISNLPSKLNFL